MKSTASATVPVLVCTLAIFLLSAMDAGMKSLVIAAGAGAASRKAVGSAVFGGMLAALDRRYRRAAVSPMQTAGEALSSAS